MAGKGNKSFSDTHYIKTEQWIYTADKMLLCT